MSFRYLLRLYLFGGEFKRGQRNFFKFVFVVVTYRYNNIEMMIIMIGKIGKQHQQQANCFGKKKSSSNLFKVYIYLGRSRFRWRGTDYSGRRSCFLIQNRISIDPSLQWKFHFLIGFAGNGPGINQIRKKLDGTDTPTISSRVIEFLKILMQI